jgi:methylaspartate mutase sigma subunit
MKSEKGNEVSNLKSSSVNIVVGVIGADCHAVGNKILTSLLNQLGYNVVNLGVMVSQEEFIDTAIETNADAIFVSSIYGHGEIDCIGLRDKCVERGLSQVLLYVGGNLVIGKHDFKYVEEKFLAMGFDRVFPPAVDIDVVSGLLMGDISLLPQAVIPEPTVRIGLSA